MAYEPWQMAVLKRYGLYDAAGKPVMSQLRTLGDESPAPKVDPEVIKRLFLADTTTTHKWTALDSANKSWVFFQAGGGEAALRQSDQSLNYLKQRFIHQYSEEQWAEHEAKFRLELGTAEYGSADQDVCQKMRGSFGYFRKWPGRNNDYEHVVVALTTYLKQYRQMLEMNKTVPEANVAPTEPAQIETYQIMQEVNKKVTNWIAAKRVRTDVRLAKHKQEDWIYNDDYITAIAPLSYAAAVKYGWQEWGVADPEKFASVSQGELHGNPWDQFVKQGGLVIFIQFNVPMPWWIKRGGEQGFEVRGLENLLLNLNQNIINQNPDSWPALDEENNAEMTVSQIKDMIRHEALRADQSVKPPNNAPMVRGQGYEKVPHPVYQNKSTFPVERGAQVVSNRQEAEDIISHFNLALDEVQRWAKKFKGKVASVVPD